jgi:hypothetical protein
VLVQGRQLEARLQGCLLVWLLYKTLMFSALLAPIACQFFTQSIPSLAAPQLSDAAWRVCCVCCRCCCRPLPGSTSSCLVSTCLSSSVMWRSASAAPLASGWRQSRWDCLLDPFSWLSGEGGGVACGHSCSNMLRLASIACCSAVQCPAAAAASAICTARALLLLPERLCMLSKC